MQDFWRLVNLYLSLMGFLVTGGILVYRGESLLYTVVRAITVFVAMYAVQNVFGSILVATVGKEPEPPESPATLSESDKPQALRN